MLSTQWDEILAARLLLSSNGHEPGTKNEMNGGRKGRGPHDERRADRTAFFSTRLRYDTQLVCHSFFLRKRITTPLQALSFSFCRDLFIFFLAGSLGHQHRHLALLASFTGADQNFLWPLGGLSGISGGVCEAGGLRSGELLGGGCWDVIGCRWKGCGRKASVYHSEGSVQRMKKEEGVGLRGGCRLELVCVSGLLPTREAEI